MYKIVLTFLFCAGVLFAQDIFTACKTTYGSGIFYDRCMENNMEKLKEFENSAAKKNDMQDEETKKLQKEIKNLQDEVKRLKNDISTLKKEIEKLQNEIKKLKK
ncbi:MAG: hypothetical protein LBP54_04520 [Campylobacteraceae bacterium]|jgi:peptidoglycan hydrolase CwlO-like protein|nr:hypothetical protein [Campylobacteraceae bacterium]